jgi:hypothetical protein
MLELEVPAIQALVELELNALRFVRGEILIPL